MINDVNLNLLPKVRLVEKETLPEKSGIYFAVDQNFQVYYVGQAQNIRARWSNHHRYHQLIKINKKNPLYLVWYECENNKEFLATIEGEFIEYYSPVLNRTKVESQRITPAEILLRKTLAKIAKYVIIFGYEENSPIFKSPSVYLKYDGFSHNPARILRQIFDADNRKGSLKWSYYHRSRYTPIWKTKCNGISIIIGCGYNIHHCLQTGEKESLAGVSLLGLSTKAYDKYVASQDWSQSYHPSIQKYVEDSLPLLWSKNLSFNLYEVEDIKKLNQEKISSKVGQGRRRGMQVKVYCEAIGKGRFVITAYQEAIEWFGGYDLMGLQRADYLLAGTDAAPKWFEPHRITLRVLEDGKYRSRSVPISASTAAQLEVRLKGIREVSPLHQKIKLKK